MNNPKIVHRLAPDIYTDNKTMLAIYDAQAKELEQYDAQIYQVFLNNLVKFCDIEGIRRFEAIFNIQADEENETLEYRRARIINKFTIQLPYTKITTKQMLDNIFGEENAQFEVIYNSYKVRIGIETEIENLIEQTISDLRREIIPANMDIETIVYQRYMHRYLKKHYTHAEMKQFTQGELSQYA